VRIYQVGDIPGALAQPQVSFTPDLPPPPRADGTQPEPAVQPMPAPQEQQPAAQQPAADLGTLEEQVRANPQAAGPAFALAQAYRAQGRLDDAANVLLVAGDANPGDVPLHQILGDILNEAGRREEAAEAYQQAIDADPSAGNINKLGAAQLAWGDLAAAKETLSKALLVDANAPDPHYFLAQLYLKEGDSARAKAELARYLELAPQGSYSGDASNLLGSLP
jgi:tetratricopeptide (TPR) repeat protein